MDPPSMREDTSPFPEGHVSSDLADPGEEVQYRRQFHEWIPSSRRGKHESSESLGDTGRLHWASKVEKSPI